MKLLLILSIALSFNAFAGVGTGTGNVPTDKQLKFIQIDDILLDTLILPKKAVSALTVGDTHYKKVKYGQQNNNLKSGLGFLIDLSEVQSVDTDKGIINLDDFPFKEGSKLLINKKSGIYDVFTKNGDLIIFNK